MVTIEPATTDDVSAVLDLWVDLADDQRRHGSHIHGEGNRTAMRAPMVEAAATDRLDVARDGPELVGYVRYDVERGMRSQDVIRGWIQDLFVVPGRRDEGIGSALLAAAETALARRGVDVVAVEAMADNEGAVRLYERHGFRPHRIEFEREVENDKRPRGNR
jgi:ribosomal protein S18 acetylase RimI-like enzyme